MCGVVAPYGEFHYALFRRMTMSHKAPLSPRTAVLHSRYRGAKQRHGICPYCAVGCGLIIFLRHGEVVGIEGDPESPVNRGRLCPKGARVF